MTAKILYVYGAASIKWKTKSPFNFPKLSTGSRGSIAARVACAKTGFLL
jgi:hypothetical protein